MFQFRLRFVLANDKDSAEEESYFYGRTIANIFLTEPTLRGPKDQIIMCREGLKERSLLLGLRRDEKTIAGNWLDYLDPRSSNYDPQAKSGPPVS